MTARKTAAKKTTKPLVEVPQIGAWGASVRRTQEALGLVPTGIWNHADAQAVADAQED